MESAQVSVGDVATASQYNNLREDVLHSGFYQIDGVDNDDTDPVTGVIVGNAEAVRFISNATGSCYFDVQIPPQIDTGEDWLLRLAFDMDTAQAGNVRLHLAYGNLEDGSGTNPALTELEETVAAPATANTLEVVTLSTLRIPNADLANGNVVTFRLSRLGGDGLDTHGGRMRVFGIQLIQNQT